MRNFFKLKSIEDAPIVRKFSVIFSLISLLPFVILAFIFFLFSSKGFLQIDYNLFFWSVIVTGVLSFIGFVIMRKTVLNIMRVSQNAKEILKGDLSKRINIDVRGNNEVTQLARAFNEIVGQLESNIRQLEKSRNTIQEVLFRVASGVSSTENIDTFLSIILETTVNAVDGKTGLLLIVDESNNELVIKNFYGLDEASVQSKRIPIDGVAAWVIKQKRPLLIPKLQKISAVESGSSLFEPPLLCAPLIFQNKILGVIVVSGRKQDANFEENELILLSNLASQIALAIENARLNADNQKTYLETITALALAVEARDIYSRGHSDRVGEYAIKIADKLSLNEQQIKTIKEASQLHDVGKIGIGDDILRKPAVLNDFEQNIMQQHPVIGEGIIIPLKGLAHLRDPIRHHHEWLDGTGYPDHLKAEQISLESRILAVADSFDAMTTDRPYRKGMDFRQAKEDLLTYKNVRYDGKVVDALINSLNL